MHNNKSYVLGIDTSNYKTSVSIIDNERNIIKDLRKLLKVKQGERGLRQSDALFQHVMNLPDLIKDAMSYIDTSAISAVAYSDKPRPVEGSYMPVFNAGASAAEMIASSLNVPAIPFSHQEGHIKAIQYRTPMDNESEFLCYHLSGGTCELLKVTGSGISIIGGSKDISFGQVIDRTGVKLGMPFPAGEYMDIAAENSASVSNHLKKIKTDGLYFNLSGIETQCSRAADKYLTDGESADELIRELMDRLSQLLIKVTSDACKETNLNNVMFTGGVSSSKYISNLLRNHFMDSGINIEFGEQSLSQDNAVGIALLGGDEIWQ